mmetsp:Transcript_5517/g.20115  ORF Transcript_5517/g.20115 Transcript_5517/m.20115 type:complete len:791 (+) Transcript_5517:127-2499(+)
MTVKRALSFPEEGDRDAPTLFKNPVKGWYPLPLRALARIGKKKTTTTILVKLTGVKVQQADGTLVFVELERGSNKVRSKSRPVTKAWVSLEDELVFTTTMYSDKKLKSFLPKACFMNVYSTSSEDKHTKPLKLACMQVDLRDLMALRKEGTGAHGNLSKVQLKGKVDAVVFLTPTINFGKTPLPVRTTTKSSNMVKGKSKARSNAAQAVEPIAKKQVSKRIVLGEDTADKGLVNDDAASIQASASVTAAIPAVIPAEQETIPATSQEGPVEPPVPTVTEEPFPSEDGDMRPSSPDQQIGVLGDEGKSPSVSELVRTFTPSVPSAQRGIVIQEVEEYVPTPEATRAFEPVNDPPPSGKADTSPTGSDTNSGDTEDSLCEAEVVSSRRSSQRTLSGLSVSQTEFVEREHMNLLRHVAEAEFVRLNAESSFSAQSATTDLNLERELRSFKPEEAAIVLQQANTLATSLHAPATSSMDIDDRFTVYASQPCLLNMDEGFDLQEDVSRVLKHFSARSEDGMPRDLGTEFLKAGKPFQIPEETMQQLQESAMHAIADTIQSNIGGLTATGSSGKLEWKEDMKLLPGLDNLDSTAIVELSSDIIKAKMETKATDIPDVNTTQEFKIAVLVGIRDHTDPTGPIAPGVAFISARRTVVEEEKDGVEEGQSEAGKKGKPWWQFWRNDCKQEDPSKQTVKSDQYEITGVKIFGAQSSGMRGMKLIKHGRDKENSRLLTELDMQLGKPRQRKPTEIMVKPGDTLWALSAKYTGRAGDFGNILKQNPKISNPNIIYAYDKINV